VTLRFEITPSDRPPAAELLQHLLDEYDADAGRPLYGGPSAKPEEFSPLAGAFLVGYEGETPVACGGVKTFQPGIGEIKRMYVVPAARGRGIFKALLAALEDAARDLGLRTARLDAQTHTWPLYRDAGYTEIPDYNENYHAHHWGEKQL
jgi:GNAT superfamily N-acetyltransferase